MCLDQDEFLRRAHIVHGDYYDYSKSKYEGIDKKVIITCPIHGDFEQSPKEHFRGYGCKKCGIDSVRRPVYGVGINDLYLKKNDPIYVRWAGMLDRCYNPKYHEKYPTYIGCSVCDEWHYLSNFKEWWDENYVEGYHLDKDIIVKGNKVYSPDTCCFVPREINNLLTRNKRVRGSLPIGVIAKKNRYRANYSYIHNGENKRRHIGYFSTPEEAFQAYKEAKEAYIKEVANEYYSDGRITKRVYDALMRYEVEITD